MDDKCIYIYVNITYLLILFTLLFRTEEKYTCMRAFVFRRNECHLELIILTNGCCHCFQKTLRQLLILEWLLLQQLLAVQLGPLILPQLPMLLCLHQLVVSSKA